MLRYSLGSEAEGLGEQEKPNLPAVQLGSFGVPNSSENAEDILGRGTLTASNTIESRGSAIQLFIVHGKAERVSAEKFRTWHSSRAPPLFV